LFKPCVSSVTVALPITEIGYLQDVSSIAQLLGNHQHVGLQLTAAKSKLSQRLHSSLLHHDIHNDVTFSSVSSWETLKLIDFFVTWRVAL
jgi:hypothetical protein